MNDGRCAPSLRAQSAGHERRRRNRRGCRAYACQARQQTCSPRTWRSAVWSSISDRSRASTDCLPTCTTRIGRKPLVEAAVQRLGGLDILVCDYPVRIDTPIARADDALETLLASRAELTLAASRAALPHLKKSPAGRIVNIGLVRSLFAIDARDAVQRAEQNLADVTRALAVETGDFGITANYVQPGGIMTPLARKIFRKNRPLRDLLHRALRRAPSRRTYRRGESRAVPGQRRRRVRERHRGYGRRRPVRQLEPGTCTQPWRT